jgi:hypothetical protein
MLMRNVKKRKKRKKKDAPICPIASTRYERYIKQRQITIFETDNEAINVMKSDMF